jgi:WD40-like Beta Propeller Repeat
VSIDQDYITIKLPPITSWLTAFIINREIDAKAKRGLAAMITKRRIRISGQLTILTILTIAVTACGTLNFEVIPPSNPSATNSLQINDNGIGYPAITPTRALDKGDLQTATPESSATSESQAVPYAGLAYGTQEGIFLFARDGKPKLLIDNPDPTSPVDAALSPDGGQVIYAGPGDIKDLWLADLKTEVKRNLTNTPDRREFSPQWWPARPDVTVFESSPIEDEYYSSGHPTVENLDGSGYRVLDAFTGGPVALSPDGQSLAFGCCGIHGVIYDWDRGATPLDPYSFNVSIQKLYNPAWSPDGKQLAWIVGGSLTAKDSWQIGVAIFDLDAHTVRFLHPYVVLGGTEPQMELSWSPNGEWLAFVNQNETEEQGHDRYLWVMQVDGGAEYSLGQGYNSVWSPDGRYLAFNHSTGTTPVELISIAPYGQWADATQLPYRGKIIGWIKE